MIRRGFTLAAGEGEVIRGDIRVPEGPPPRSAILIAHGFKGFKDWGFFPHTADALAGDGHAVVTFNFSRNGIGPDPLEFTELDAFAANTFTRELDELLRILDEVSSGELLGWVPRRVGLLGHSRGGGDAILAAAERGDALNALVTWAAVADFDRWGDDTKREWRELGRLYVLNGRTGQHMPLDLALLEDFERNRDRLDILRAAAQVHTPWLVVHGRDDLTVAMADAHRLIEANPAARFEPVAGAGHTFEATHPFGDEPEPLARALGVTRLHFRRTLRPEDS